MKRFRFLLLALVLGVTSLLAVSESLGQTDPPCSYSQQYYKLGFSYMPTGTIGLQYTCIPSPGATCTYWLPDPVLGWDNYVPCRQGSYYRING